MAKYSSKDLTLTVGGTDMTQHLLRIGNLKISAILQESHTFGDAWFEAISTGIKKGDDIVLGGFYDDTAATGPDAIFGGSAIGSTVAVVITWGGTKTSSFNAIIESYDRVPTKNQMHEFNANLRPTGTITEA